MKVKIVDGYTMSGLERDVNYYISQLEEENRQIIDIKFSIRESTYHEFFAMIIYK